MDLEWGQFSDAPPDQWLLWAGKGPYGQTRYACGDHRIELRDFVRRHYGTLGWHPHARVLGTCPRRPARSEDVPFVVELRDGGPGDGYAVASVAAS